MLKVIEGTWEEIKTHDHELAGRRVRLVVLPESEPVTDAPGHSNGVPLSERFARFIGCVNSSGENASEDHSRLFTDYLEQKRRDGTL